MDKEIKRREDRVRRQLTKQGLALRKSRVFTPSADDQGGYMIVDSKRSITTRLASHPQL